MSQPTTVLIVELDQQLAELEQIILNDEGFHAIPTVCGPDSLQKVQQVNPDVILLDLGMHTHSCGWQLLEELRANKDTQGLPLLVLSDTEKLLEDAKQSFNVRQELMKPFDIDRLVNGVKAAVAGTPLLPHPAAPPTEGKLSAEAAQVISREAVQIMAEWLKRAQQEKVLGSRSNIPARVLMNNISVWLIGLVSVLRYGVGYLGTAEIRGKLANHIHEAQNHGVTLAQIIKQFEILRDLVWQTLEHSSLADLTSQDVFQLGKTLNFALDEVMVELAEQYGPPAQDANPPPRTTTR
jgi:CheY-like chemotaxis protein